MDLEYEKCLSVSITLHTDHQLVLYGEANW